MNQTKPFAALVKWRISGSFLQLFKVDNDPFFIVHSNVRAKDEAPEYKLVSAICPHAGGTVRPMEGELICPLHYWSFDASTGVQLTFPVNSWNASRLLSKTGILLFKLLLRRACISINL